MTWTSDKHQGYLEAELLRTKGKLAYRCGDTEIAAASLRDSIDVASAQGAGWLEQRALRSRASLFSH